MRGSTPCKPRCNFERLVLRNLQLEMERSSTDFIVETNRFTNNSIEYAVLDALGPENQPVMNISIFISEFGQGAHIDYLEVFPSYRGRSLSSAALRVICRVADRLKEQLTLTVGPYPVLNHDSMPPRDTKFLREFYSRYGFEPESAYADPDFLSYKRDPKLAFQSA